ncbi:MAG TPA: PfkB family carbohydrate kinase [Actinopolymorphaceae bacterium]
MRPAPRIVVVGDVLLDRDIRGEVARSCEDGAAPVLDTQAVDERPGGAGLAALLAARAGADVVLVGAFADEPTAGRLRELLEPYVRVIALPGSGRTPVKARVRTHHEFLVRIDDGGPCPPGDFDLGEVRTALEGADAILVSDYRQGMTVDSRVRLVLEAAARTRPTVWDPHRLGADPLPGVKLVTPNEAEASSASVGGTSGDGTGRLARVREAADRLIEKWQVTSVAVTLADDGALLSFGYGAPMLAPASAVVDGDTCGAGDCLAAFATLARAYGATISQAVVSGVEAATDFVASGGASGLTRPLPRAPQSTRTLIDRLHAPGKTLVATGGCFDLLHPGHVSMLRHARALGDGLVVLLNTDDSVRRLKGEGRPVTSQWQRRAVLEALEAVDVVLFFDEDTPARLLEQLRPDIWVKGGDYAGRDLDEADVVRRHGGEVVLVPYLEGHSTTGLIDTASAVRAREPDDRHGRSRP